MDLEQREHDIRNALSKVGVEPASQIVKLIKRDDMAEVFINGEYFDTYDFNSETFLEHGSEFISDNLLINEKNKTIVYAVIGNNHSLNNPDYADVKLKLPASPDDIKAVFEKAGITNSQNYKIECLHWNNFVIDSDEIKEASIEELNFFGRRICEMDQNEHLAFEACLLIDQKYRSIKELINLTYSLANYRILHRVGNDIELGQYYADNGFITELDEVPEVLTAFIDLEKIGRMMRESEKGIFLEGCYITKESEELEQVYDGISLPQAYEAGSIFTAYISFGDNISEKSLCLPADEEQISTFIDEFRNMIVSFNSAVMGTARPRRQSEE